jgi:hypothetical protein
MAENNLHSEAIIKVREKSKESAGKVKEDLKQRKERLAEKIGENATDIRERVSSFSKALKEKLWDGKLVKYSELAEWMKDNEYIRDFYRPELRDTWVRHCSTCFGAGDLILFSDLFEDSLPVPQRDRQYLVAFARRRHFPCSYL